MRLVLPLRLEPLRWFLRRLRCMLNLSIVSFAASSTAVSTTSLTPTITRHVDPYAFLITVEPVDISNTFLIPSSVSVNIKPKP